MGFPKFSVVIPAYNQAQYLPNTINSILNQTYNNFEIIVVNDASPDNTNEVIQQFTDPRVNLLIHEKNKGLPGARNTGMRAATGEYIALLDADDYFHPQKLEVHAAYLEQHPEIAVTYNSRFDLNYSDTTIRELFRPPLTVGLMDFIHGFPFAPSDMVIRKSVAEQFGYFDETYIHGGEDLEYPCRLALMGCQFASVDRALNYRRHHSGRYRKNLPGRLDDVKNALAMVWSHPNCPEEIRQLGETPIAEHYMALIYHAFIQDLTNLGQEYTHNLVNANPAVLMGNPCPLVDFFVIGSASDESCDHASILQKLFSQFPPLPVDITDQLNVGIGKGYLIKGVRAVIWEREQAAVSHFNKAAEIRAKFSKPHLGKIAKHLVDYEVEMGDEALQATLTRLLPYLKQHCSPGHLRWFLGNLAVNRGFENFRHQQYQRVAGNVWNAILNEPKYMFNRGILSMLVRSLLKKNTESKYAHT